MSGEHETGYVMPPCLLARDGFGRGNLFPLAGSTVIGRGMAGGVRIDDPAVSRLHCLVHPDAGPEESGCRWNLCDLGSANGTWLNGRRVTRPARLNHGDVIRLGRTRSLVVVLTAQGVERFSA